MAGDDSHQVVVLGAGLAGLAASSRLAARGVDVCVLEKAPRPGGLSSSMRVDGFTFDHGPHVSFTKREDIRRLFARAVDGRFKEARAELLNLWRGHWIPHPAQSHLFGLPLDVVVRCLVDFTAASRQPPATLATYQDWCVANLGRAFSEEFTFRYTRKYWTAEARQLTADWVGNRMHAPALEEVLRGALSEQPADQHYITSYRYPTDGGYEPYVKSVLTGQRIEHGEEVVSVLPGRRSVELASGRAVDYQILVSSLPLPVLVERTPEAPLRVRQAAERLRCSELVLVNVGVDRADGFPSADWMYFYDEDLVFARGNFPHRLGAANAPAGCGSIQVEIYGSPYRPLASGSLLQQALDDLRRAGLLHPGDRIKVAHEQRVPFANIIFDHHRAEALGVVRSWLQQQGIESCGRFGEWEYLWSDDSIHSGWRAAERVGARLGLELLPESSLPPG
jgi:protoporphyrinogen oxidase